MFSIFSIKPPKCRSCSWKKTTFFMYQTNLFANSFRVIGWSKLFIWEMQPGNRLQKTLHGHVQRCFEVRNVQLASWSALWGDPKWTANQPPETVKGEKKTPSFLSKRKQTGYIGQFQKSDAVGLYIQWRCLSFHIARRKLGWQASRLKTTMTLENHHA